MVKGKRFVDKTRKKRDNDATKLFKITGSIGEFTR